MRAAAGSKPGHAIGVRSEFGIEKINVGQSVCGVIGGLQQVRQTEPGVQPEANPYGDA